MRNAIAVSGQLSAVKRSAILLWIRCANGSQRSALRGVGGACPPGGHMAFAPAVGHKRGKSACCYVRQRSALSGQAVSDSPMDTLRERQSAIGLTGRRRSLPAGRAYGIRPCCWAQARKISLLLCAIDPPEGECHMPLRAGSAYAPTLLRLSGNSKK
ncbi:MAG: hypothetical protein F6J93_31175 [Oscillatoria sp. SIO1A7]|nr:hypothetical protein [Oscillatoria sp. SIO1A7]